MKNQLIEWKKMMISKEDEIRIGSNAEKANNLFFKDYFANQMALLYGNFISGELSDSEKAHYHALIKIRNDLAERIQSGIYAQQSKG